MEDPVVEEIRQARDADTKQFNYDLDAVCDNLRQREKGSAIPAVTLPPKHLVTRRLHQNVPDTAPGDSGSLERESRGGYDGQVFRLRGIAPRSKLGACRAA